jgi:alpha-beta hydrolase superfamily lysophospholipase
LGERGGWILRKSLLFAAIFIAFLISSGNANASGQIYLLRGLAGIFSTGLDILDQKLVQRGFTATVHGHLDYEELASEAARLQKSGKSPIIIMGHSLGADAAIFMADKMKSLGAPVTLVVTFGPTMNLVAPSNVSQVINYYTGNTVVAKGPGFRGTISNVNLNGAADINHLNVETSNRLHASVISKVQAIVDHRRAAPITRQDRASPAAAIQ